MSVVPNFQSINQIGIVIDYVLVGYMRRHVKPTVLFHARVGYVVVHYTPISESLTKLVVLGAATITLQSPRGARHIQCKLYSE